MLYYESLIEHVFDNNAIEESDEITIISGYVGAYPVKKLKEIPSKVHVTVVYGMYGFERISAPLHKALLKLQAELPNVDIYYSTVPVHSKLYLWKRSNVLKKALIGSANFTRSGLENDYKEILADVETSTFSQYEEYDAFIKKYCIPCTDKAVVAKRIRTFRRWSSVVGKSRNVNQSYFTNGHLSCVVSLLNDQGEVSEKSGLNWCLSNGHVAKDDAYIRIPKVLCVVGSILFPPKKYVGRQDNEGQGKRNRENDEIELLWDDGTIMPALLEGTQVINGVKYPKQISSSPSKSILGKYIRNRLGVSSEHKITKEDLIKAFGRTDITISWLADGVYLMDLKN